MNTFIKKGLLVLLTLTVASAQAVRSVRLPDGRVITQAVEAVVETPAVTEVVETVAPVAVATTSRFANMFASRDLWSTVQAEAMRRYGVVAAYVGSFQTPSISLPKFSMPSMPSVSMPSAEAMKARLADVTASVNANMPEANAKNAALLVGGVTAGALTVYGAKKAYNYVYANKLADKQVAQEVGTELDEQEAKQVATGRQIAEAMAQRAGESLFDQEGNELYKPCGPIAEQEATRQVKIAAVADRIAGAVEPTISLDITSGIQSLEQEQSKKPAPVVAKPVATAPVVVKPVVAKVAPVVTRTVAPMYPTLSDVDTAKTALKTLCNDVVKNMSVKAAQIQAAATTAGLANNASVVALCQAVTLRSVKQNGTLAWNKANDNVVKFNNAVQAL